MKKLAAYFILLLFATLLGLAISLHSGYVLIAYRHTVIETTLWIAIFSLLCCFAIFYGLIRSGNNVYHLPQTINHLINRNRQQRIHNHFISGIQKILENDWQKAEQLVHKATKIKSSNVPLIHYLILAFANHKLQQIRQRDYQLDAAQKSYCGDAKALFIISLMRLNLLMLNQQYEEALALTCCLRHTHPHHKLLLQQLQTIYLHQQDWTNLHALLPVLFRHKISSKETLEQLEQLVYLELWRICLKTNNEKKINIFWRKLPRRLRYEADIVDLYVTYLEKNNNITQAEKLTVKILNKKWQSKLVEHYGCLVSNQPWKQLKIAENWLKTHTSDAFLFLTLGHICQRQKLWGKAKYYLELYAKLMPGLRAYKSLGELMEQQGDKEMALRYYHKGFQINKE